MRQIIFQDGRIFDVSDAYPVDIEPSVFAKRFRVRGEQRETLRLTLAASYADIAAAFVDGASYVLRVPAEDGGFEDYDKSDYCVAGDIVDHRDGRVTVYMGQKTEGETLAEEYAQLLFETLTGGEY